jgi:hypothetical protein
MKIKNAQRGQALITLLFFTVIGVTVTTAAVVMILVNSISGEKFQEGMIAYQIAQSGAENAKLRFLRDPNYTGTGEIITIGSGTAVVDRSGTGPFIFTSTGTNGNFIRKIQFTADYSGNTLSITNQHELF